MSVIGMGIKRANPGKKPRKYEITEAAKNKIGGNDREPQHS